VPLCTTRYIDLSSNQTPKIIGHMVSENRCGQLHVLQKERIILTRIAIAKQWRTSPHPINTPKASTHYGEYSYDVS
jgi:hypothetical protein